MSAFDPLQTLAGLIILRDARSSYRYHCTRCSPDPDRMATLRMDSDHGSYEIEVHRVAGSGYPVRFQCIENCPRHVDYAEQLSDHPLGLFSRDQDALIFYLSSSGSAYQARAWQITDAGIRRVAELYSRGRPDFLSDANGHAVILTYEGD
jgi:hypothetical protein